MLRGFRRPFQTAHHGTDAGHHLGAGKGLDDIIVGADIEPHDAVVVFTAGRDHQDRDVGFGTDGAA